MPQELEWVWRLGCLLHHTTVLVDQYMKGGANHHELGKFQALGGFRVGSVC